jgi:hypothetical protein
MGMGAIFFCRVANLSALGIIEDSCLARGPCGIEMRMGRRPIRSRIRFVWTEGLFFYVGDFWWYSRGAIFLWL